MPALKVMETKWMVVFILFLIFQVNAYSEEIYLKNGDRLTGDVINENEESITIETEAMGIITIRRNFVKRISGTKEKTAEVNEDVKEAIWQREISLGYNKASGNTEVSQLSMSVFANRKREHINEFTLKADVYYSSSNKKMDAQKWYGMARYGFSFGEGKKWYNFYNFEADHDKFANIDYRIIPATGIGYWFYDLSEAKVMAELGIGLEHTVYRDQIKDSDEVVLIPRAFLEKEVFDNAKISQDLSLYPTLDDPGVYRLRSETAFTTLVTQKLSLRLSLIDDYNSDPAGNTKKNDLRFISSLAYSF